MATLKISDLSVGDWVKASGVAKRVHSIEFQNGAYFVNFSDPDTNSGDYLHAPFIEPIPITPEILETNGWERNDEDLDMEYYGDPTSGIAHTKGTFHYRVESPEVSVVCYFVHQLQHALRLAGVDKEIVMPNKWSYDNRNEI